MEEIVAKIGLYNLVRSTTLESNRALKNKGLMEEIVAKIGLYNLVGPRPWNPIRASLI